MVAYLDDARSELAVLRLVLAEHPTILRRVDVLRQLMTVDADQATADRERDGFERAIRELRKLDVVFMRGDLVYPSPAALYFKGIDLSL